MQPPIGDQVEEDRSRKDERFLAEEAADEYVEETAGHDPDAATTPRRRGSAPAAWARSSRSSAALIVLLLAAGLFYNFSSHGCRRRDRPELSRTRRSRPERTASWWLTPAEE